MFSISFRKHRDEKKENNLFTLIIKCKFSLRAPSLREQLVLVLSPSSYRNMIFKSKWVPMNFDGTKKKLLKGSMISRNRTEKLFSTRFQILGLNVPVGGSKSRQTASYSK